MRMPKQAAARLPISQGSGAPARALGGIQSLAGRGRPLDQPMREFFDTRFGHDFSDVRIHTDARAAELAGAIQARAFTVGRDVVWRG